MGWLADLGAKLREELRAKPRRSLGQSIDPYADTGENGPVDEMEVAYGPPKADENGCMIIGRDNVNYPFGRYRVCLTPNQERTLFNGKRKQQKKIGCGVFACAYTAPGKTKVVKFTRDSEDVAALLQAQKTGVVPKVHAVYKLKQGGKSAKTGETTPVYALVVDRLIPLSRPEREAADEQLVYITDIIHGYFTREDACGSDDCGPLFEGVLDATKKLRDIGIVWKDIHSGNIAFDPKTGEVKIIDLGVTGTELKRRIKILRGLGQSRLDVSQVSLIP